MQVVILCSEAQQAELMSTGTNPENFLWIENVKELLQYKQAAVVIDLLFELTEERLLVLQQLAATVIINSVIYPLHNIHPHFIRINGWPTFLASSLIEAACLDSEKKQLAEEAFALLGKKLEWVPDVPGFITPRIISAIINEAYFALADGVSTPAEIDTAMKLGTAYPYGPLEWSEKIGVQNIVALLQTASVTQGRYTPARLLVEEGQKTI